MQGRSVKVVSMFVVVGVTLVSIGSSADQKDQKDEYYQPSHPVRNVQEMAKDAKENGLKKIVVPPTLVDYNEVPGVDEIFSRNATALVKVRTIESFYKEPYRSKVNSNLTLDIVQYITGKETITSNVGVAPSAVTVEVLGGDLVDNGVEVVQRSRFPKFQVGDEFVAVLSAREENGRTRYSLPYGPDSLIGIDSNGSIKSSPWLRAGSLKDFLAQNKIKSLTELDARIREIGGAK